MEELNNTPIPAPMYEPLDAKDVARIQRLSGQQIVEMEARHLMRLTHDFDERYARLVVEKGNNSIDQGKLLKALKDAFDNIHITDWWNNDPQYDKTPPSYFSEWDFQIAIDGSIVREHESILQIEIPSAPTLSEMLAEEGLLKEWLREANHSLESALCVAKENAEEVFTQIKTLRDGSLTRMQEKLSEAEKQMETMHLELTKLRKWHEEWELLRQSILESYDPADVAEAGGLDDPTAMADAVESIMDAYQSEKKLMEENDRLRESQEKWRESSEYLAEKQKWENVSRQSIKVEVIKKGLLAVAKGYMGNGEMLYNLTLQLNQMLKGTAWETVSSSILDEVKTTFENSKPHNPTNIFPKQMNVDTLKAEQVNDIHDNDKVNFGTNGSER